MRIRVKKSRNLRILGQSKKLTSDKDREHFLYLLKNCVYVSLFDRWFIKRRR